MSELVLDNERRRELSAALGMPFGRTRALRRIAAQEMTMGELASALGIDAPAATSVVDELELLGLVERRAHPTDRRAKLVVLTPRGAAAARKANAILATPPASFAKLSDEEVEALAELLDKLAALPPTQAASGRSRLHGTTP
jgi:DNA-binding MarR family transcriptional regulator